MDFFTIKERSTKNGIIEVYPDFKVGRSKDLMIRGKSFYAIWDEEKSIWSTDEYDVQRLVDAKLLEYRASKLKKTDGTVHAKLMSDFSTKSWSEFQYYVKNLSDNSNPLDENLTFSNTKIKKSDYVSRRLPYPLEKGSIEAYDEVIGTLYTPEERAKLEWAIGSVVAGDSKYIQKFIVLYGEAGAGKSTILNIIQQLFEGYYTTFEAKALTTSNNSFSTEVFAGNPLVALQHDGDLSKIEDNTKLNSIISHEDMTMNEKYKPSYMARVNAFLFMATNKPVKITDAKSGIIRRLIDVKPSGNRLTPKRYFDLIPKIDFELGSIAAHCLAVYREMGKNYYMAYRPIDMMMQTDVFYNFVEAHFHIFKEQDGASLTQAYDIYKVYCDDSMIDWKLQRHKFREELKNYFKTFSDVTRVDGKQVRSYYEGFLTDKFTHIQEPEEEASPNSVFLNEETSLLDTLYPDTPAQYATKSGIPKTKWANVKTTLKDLDTKKLHYIKVPQNHIVIDFDITDDDGNKSMALNLEAASKWPATYSEFSKSGNGVHLHYIYDGDVERLSRVFDDEIEVKVFNGDSSLRRKLTKCNDVPLVTINSGLPLKGEKMINPGTMKTEKSLRSLIKRNLNKEIHDATKPSIDFIHKILQEAYDSDMVYDVTDMRPYVLTFANNSSNQAAAAVKLVASMKFKSELPIEGVDDYGDASELAFFDIEVFPNLLAIVWKFKGEENKCVRMINPTPAEVTQLFELKIIGFNCRRYDNHIMYARHMGYNNQELFDLSQKIINNSRNGLFGQAYGISYADIYDYATKKQSLKKWEIELGIKHSELGLPWDEPVDESLWSKVLDYCEDDVRATEATFNATHSDFVAREILADLSGLTVNDTTQNHTAKILFGNDPNPQSKFEYVDLSEEFNGYEYNFGKSTYRGEDPSEGGYVYAEPGIYRDVAILDVVSMHPNSLINLNHFGIYTKAFQELVEARVHIKNGRFDEAGKMMGGILKKYLVKRDKKTIKELAFALKIVINIVYGMTSAKFDNKFKHPKNVDNIVAKRGALFMIDLKHAVQERGFTVAHIKTDSIKIPNATPEIIEFVHKFGKKYGYDFEHEATFEKLCLVNQAVYVAKVASGENEGNWDAVGTQFQEPYVYKTLFSKEPITFKDKCETKSVTTALYLDFNEDLAEDEHDYHFIGKVGLFSPIKEGKGGAVLLREKEGKYNSASGAKGYRWLESHMVESLGKEDDIDLDFYREKVDTAISSIAKYGDAEEFIEG